ncbi:MazG-like family protein [Streptomyces sp. NPDC004134]|uniref:MazG-like family protein n=1 Tax=Streptomyces sp. NPDC004134 TaxID=3364691 RepID=UPI0036AF0EDC
MSDITAPDRPAAWIDGDPLMEAIALAVYERCATGDGGIVHDDPRNIAAAAALAIETTTSLWPVTAQIAATLDQANGTAEHERAMRLLKISEEAGEAAAAYIGMTGQNPRKGTTHTARDVADELCDVIIAAAVALHDFTTAPPAVLDAKVHAAARRLDTAAQEEAKRFAALLTEGRCPNCCWLDYQCNCADHPDA